MTIKENEDFLLIESKIPRIAKNLEMFWGYKEFNDYVKNLFMDTRDGQRAGFPKDIAKSLAKLLNKHLDEFPQFIEVSKHPW